MRARVETLVSVFSRCESQGGEVLRIFVVVVLCVGVLLQILGVAVSFWELHGSDDPFYISLMTGFALVSSECPLSPLLTTVLQFTPLSFCIECLRPYLLFHPPL